MSYWEQNKETFKSAGVATAKGIGRGTKALGSAGYRTYKNRSGTTSTEKEVPEYVPGQMPVLSKDQLHALPAPPRRGQPQPSVQPPVQPYPVQAQPNQVQSNPAQFEQNPVQMQPNPSHPMAVQPIQGQSIQPGAQPQNPPAQQVQEPNQAPPQNLFQQAAPHMQTLGNIMANPQVQSIYSHISNQPDPNQIPSYQQATATPPGVPPRNVPAPGPGAPPQPDAVPQSSAPATNVSAPINPAPVHASVPSVVPAPTVPGAVAPTPVDPASMTPPLATAYSASAVPSAVPNPGAAATSSAPTGSANEAADAVKVPKPVPDASKFAPPPIHKGRGNSCPNPAIAAAPSLPSRSSTSQVQGSSSANTYNQASTSAPAPPSYSTKNNQKTPVSAESRPVRYTEIDLSKVGPPPPRRFDSTAKELRPRGPSPATSQGSYSIPQGQSPPTSQGQSPSVGPQNVASPRGPDSADSRLPPPPPPRSASAASSVGSDSANVPKAKKAPPPKPKKSQALSVNQTEGSISDPKDVKEQTEIKGVAVKPPINFAAEIANLKLGKASPQPSHTPLESGTAKSPPPKPLKPQLSAEPPIVKPLNNAPAKPQKPPAKPPALKSSESVSGPDRLKTPEAEPAKPESLTKPEKPKKLVSVQETAKPAGPPIPAKNRTSTPPTVASPPPPPAPRNYKRPAAALPKPAAEPELDLDLSSGWFANTSSELQLPQSLQRLSYSSSLQTSMSTISGVTTTDFIRTLNVTLRDLSKVEYAIKWQNQDIQGASAQKLRFVPSPITSKVPSKAELVSHSAQFGDHIVAWCEHHLGQQVGSGECWDLAKFALEKGCGRHAFVSQYYHHGFPILELSGSDSGFTIVKEPMDEVRAGDILQFTSARFENKATGRMQMVGSPNHTSVVVGKENERIFVLESNVNNVRAVQRGEYILRDITQGSVVVYRPMPKSWAE